MQFMSQKKYCINCFCILNAEATICSRCKYQQELEESPLYLRPPVRLMDQYYIGRVLGHGGFAITYLAYDRNLGTKVAIKEYFPIEFATRDNDGLTVVPFIGKSAELFQSGKDKFLTEARLLANFRSPHIIKIRQFFTAYNTAYFVMEYLTGQTLDQYIQQQGGKLPFAEVRKILLLLLDALAEVHENTIFHRDIKPENIYLTAEGDPILLDFGAARQSMSGQTTHLLSFLTPGFAATEQYSSNGIQGPWTDIYSLAATVYYALTGVFPPVPSDRMLGDAELLPPSQMGSDISPQDEEWLLKALALQWSQRPDSIRLWRSMIENPFQVIQLDSKTQIRNAEDNFSKIAILPKLTKKTLTPRDEQAIYDSAAFMALSTERVRELIIKALLETGSHRGPDPEDEAQEKDRLKREREDKRLAEEQWWDAEMAEQDGQKYTRPENSHEATIPQAKNKQARFDELAQKEEDLKRKEEELKRKEAQFEREQELLRKEEELRQKEAQLKVLEENQKQKTSETKTETATRSLSEQEIEELEEISDEEINDLLKLFADPKPKPPAPKNAERHSLDSHYARIATKLSEIPVSNQRLIAPGTVSLPSRISNGLGMEFALIYPTVAGSDFVLYQGYSVGPPEWGFETLSQRPFYMQITPVTQRHWQMLMYNTPSFFDDDPLMPVEQVSWDDCQLFIQRMNQFQEAKYRLPSEVEWEFACGAGAKTLYFFGDAEADLKEYAWYSENSAQHTHAVGMKRLNPMGLFDMLGNVREWTQDLFRPLAAPQQPGPDQRKKQPERVVRGSAWDMSAKACQTRQRSGEPSNQRKSNLGFRLVMDIV
jgi:serine/threonine protein kinase